MREYRIKSVMIQALFSAVGLLVGVAQLLLLGGITAALIGKKGSPLPYIAAKALIYVAFILLIYFFIPQVIYIAAGYGVGIIAGAFINFMLRR